MRTRLEGFILHGFGFWGLGFRATGFQASGALGFEFEVLGLGHWVSRPEDKGPVRVLPCT